MLFNSPLAPPPDASHTLETKLCWTKSLVIFEDLDVEWPPIPKLRSRISLGLSPYLKNEEGERKPESSYPFDSLSCDPTQAPSLAPSFPSP